MAMFVFSKSLKRFKVSFQSVVQLTLVYDYKNVPSKYIVYQIEPMYSYIEGWAKQDIYIKPGYVLL